jgi:transcriptional regulator with XRE-family HTH domain
MGIGGKFMNMAQKLVKSRLENNLTQKQLGEAIGISISVIGNIETGSRKPSKNVAFKLSQYFNTKINYWFEEKEAVNYVLGRNDLDNTKRMIDTLTQRGYIKKGIVDDEACGFLIKALKLDLQLTEVKKGII